MPVYVKDLNCPKDVQENEIKESERVERFLQSRNKKLGEDQIRRIEQYLKKIIKNAKKEYEPLRTRLSKYSDQMEGVVEETNFPFEGASNVTLRYGASLARTFKAQFNKTVYSDEDLAYPVFDPGAEKEMNMSTHQIIDLQDGFNHSIRIGSNAIKELKKGTIPAFRDGTFLLHGSWERCTEMVNDQRTYRDAATFQKDYPSPQDAGIGEEEYQNLMDNWLLDEESELVARFSYNWVKMDGIEYRQMLRSKFLIYPTTVQKIDKASLYGCMLELTKDEIQQRANKGEFYENQVKKVIALRAGISLDTWDRSRMFVEGRASPQPDSIPYKLADIVFKFDLDKDKSLEQYCGKIAMEGENVVLLALRPYDIRHNIPNVVAFRLVDRDHAFDGISLIGDGKDIFNQVDDLFRHDNNVMMLTTSPMFLADANHKDELDLGRSENVLRPGLTLWIPNLKASEPPFMQIPIQDVAAASGDNNTKISILSRFVEMLLGVNQGESGNQTPDDPRAPAHKTALLMMSAGKRIDECIDTWCFSLEEFFKLHAALLYQFHKAKQYTFNAKSKIQMQNMVNPQQMSGYQTPEIKSFDIELLANPKLHWLSRKRSVSLTPEYAINRETMLFSTYAQMRPLLMQGDPVALEIWNRIVMNSGEPQPDKFLIDPQQAPQLANMAIQKAMQQFQLKGTMEAEAKGKTKLAQESAKAIVKHLSEAAMAQTSGAAEAEMRAHPELQPSLNGGRGA